MASYTPEFLAAVRRRYEDTDQPMPSIAREVEIGLRTLHRMAEREGWARRSERPPRDLPPAVKLLEEARALERTHEVNIACEPPAREPLAREAAADAAPDGSIGSSGDPLARIEQLVLRELEAEETVRDQLSHRPRTGSDATRCARTLAALTQTLQTLARLRAGAAPTDDTDYDDNDDSLPRDIDEFRRDLARRIDAFVARRTDERPAERDGGPEQPPLAPPRP